LFTGASVVVVILFLEVTWFFLLVLAMVVSDEWEKTKEKRGKEKEVRRRERI
jgi:hypothetical protein